MSKYHKKRLMRVSAISALALGTFLYNPQVTQAEEGLVERIQGNDRYETATLISSQTYASSETVIIANAMEFADALAGVPLAYEKEAPILLAYGSKLRETTQAEIERLGAKEAVILGGNAAISQSIEQELKALGLTVQRISGDNRFETSALIADELGKTSPSNKAVVVDGMNFADAMSIAPFAAQEGMPIYLTHSHKLSNADELDDYNDTYIVGGESAVSSTVENALNSVTRLAGLDRYETNREVLDYFGVEASELFVSTGLNFADALTGSVLAAQNKSAVALVKGDVHSKLLDQFGYSPFTRFTILGGEAAVSNNVVKTLEGYLNGTATSVDEEEERQVDAVVEYDLSVGYAMWDKYFAEESAFPGSGHIGFFQEEGKLRVMFSDGMGASFFDAPIEGGLIEVPNINDWDNPLTIDLQTFGEYVEPVYEEKDIIIRAGYGNEEGEQDVFFDFNEGYDEANPLVVDLPDISFSVNMYPSEGSLYVYHEGELSQELDLKTSRFVIYGPNDSNGYVTINLTHNYDPDVHVMPSATQTEPNPDDTVVDEEPVEETPVEPDAGDVKPVNPDVDDTTTPVVDEPIDEGATEVVDAYAFDLMTLNTEMLSLINAERAVVGVDPLSYDATLAEGTAIRADELLSEDSLTVNGVGHIRPDGTAFNTAFEYLGNGEEAMLGENIAQNWIDIEGMEQVDAGTTTIEKVLAKQFYDQYYNSPGHYQNMINGQYTGFATDIRISEQGKSFNAQIFSLDRDQFYIGEEGNIYYK